MKKNNCLVVYDDLLYELERLNMFTTTGSSSVELKKDIQCKNNGVINISLSSPTMVSQIIKKIEEEPSNKDKWLHKLYDTIPFASNDIIVYRILLINYILYSENGVASITLKELHSEYRNKAFLYTKEKIDKTTISKYMAAIVKLQNRMVYINFADSKKELFTRYINNNIYSFRHNLLIVSSWSPNDINFKICYSLGAFGEYLKVSQHYNSMFTKNIVRLNLNQINTYNMAVYICRMIFINKRGRSSYKLNIKLILERNIRYDTEGNSKRISLLSYLVALDTKKRVKFMKIIEKNILFILNELKSNKKIKDYKIIGLFKYKYLVDDELKIEIKFK